jgi:hypothetical protein
MQSQQDPTILLVKGWKNNMMKSKLTREQIEELSAIPGWKEFSADCTHPPPCKDPLYCTALRKSDILATPEMHRYNVRSIVEYFLNDILYTRTNQETLEAARSGNLCVSVTVPDIGTECKYDAAVVDADYWRKSKVALLEIWPNIKTEMIGQPGMAMFLIWQAGRLRAYRIASQK